MNWKKVLKGMSFFIPFTVFSFSILPFLGYVKDDAYITFRYSNNLIKFGEIAFNQGEKLEGYTNFLWMILMSIPPILNLDQLITAKILSFGFAIGAVYYVNKMTHSFYTDKEKWGIGSLWSALLLASSTSFALWSMSGLENAFFLFLITGGSYFLFKFRDSRDCKRSDWLSALFLSLACMTRPEAHLLIVFAFFFRMFPIIKRKRIVSGDVIWAAIPFFILGSYHLFRFVYFGSIYPNTYLVKGSPLLSDVLKISFKNGFSISGVSYRYMKGLLSFNLNWLLIITAFLGLFAEIKKKRAVYFLSFVIVFSFLAYHIKIGKDSMILYRLFLPALPFLAILSVRSIKVISDRIPYVKKFSDMMPGLLVVPVSIYMISVSHSRSNEYLGSYIEKSEKSHQACGEYLKSNAKTDDVVVFQDMGATPYVAENVKFFDTIGIVNPWMGKELHKINYNPFLKGSKLSTPEGRKQLRSFSKKFKDHVFNNVDPAWVAFIAYSPKIDGNNMSHALYTLNRNYFRNKNVKWSKFDSELTVKEEDVPEITRFFSPSLKYNKYYFGLYKDHRFQERYVLDNFWRRTESYWIVLFKKKTIQQ